VCVCAVKCVAFTAKKCTKMRLASGISPGSLAELTSLSPRLRERQRGRGGETEGVERKGKGYEGKSLFIWRWKFAPS